MVRYTIKKDAFRRMDNHAAKNALYYFSHIPTENIYISYIGLRLKKLSPAGIKAALLSSKTPFHLFAGQNAQVSIIQYINLIAQGFQILIVVGSQ